MREITIDCRESVSRPDLHRAFANALSFPDDYGNNLDALYDCLTEIAEPTRIQLLCWKNAAETLGNYAQSAKRAILDAAIQNPNLTVCFD